MKRCDRAWSITQRKVSLGLKPGRGLKPFLEARTSLELGVSLGLKPGRGLKPFLEARTSLELGVSLGLKPGRGLKHGLKGSKHGCSMSRSG
uniref:Uncharacterized protein n=1 Tax=mine drainage metagenome TaxID=410659 RepID=E6PNE0_9ZZZZ